MFELHTPAGDSCNPWYSWIVERATYRAQSVCVKSLMFIISQIYGVLLRLAHAEVVTFSFEYWFQTLSSKLILIFLFFFVNSAFQTEYFE